eukprot:m.275826 g.275826  ORF g.275826 m.275826 type:complete len:84 (+) comp11099_c0_seq10:840-1091(+)
MSISLNVGLDLPPYRTDILVDVTATAVLDVHFAVLVTGGGSKQIAQLDLIRVRGIEAFGEGERQLAQMSALTNTFLPLLCSVQ